MRSLLLLVFATLGNPSTGGPPVPALLEPVPVPAVEPALEQSIESSLIAADVVEADCPAPRPGTLTLNTLPWTMVAVDGVVVGSTPLFRFELSAGPHLLTLTNTGRGVAVDEPVVIEEGHAHKLKLLLAASDGEAVLNDSNDGADVSCVDEQDAAWVTVDTRPWSKVWVDGRLVGVTPVFQHKVSSGSHAVRVMSGSGILRAARFTAAPGEVVKIVLALVVPAAAAPIDPDDILDLR
ncbi:MAG: hypothetical protein Q8O67_15285 [Deltaproteobacteria bacterium]|nr:hypothetical protein [Deltaproteobacteria bacterium]